MMSRDKYETDWDYQDARQLQAFLSSTTKIFNKYPGAATHVMREKRRGRCPTCGHFPLFYLDSLYTCAACNFRGEAEELDWRYCRGYREKVRSLRWSIKTPQKGLPE